MQNLYLMAALKKDQDIPAPDRASIFFKMLDFTKGKQALLMHEDGLLLKNFLGEQKIFVAHRLVQYKGRTRFFNGVLCITNVSDLINFMHDAKASGDLRPLIISPVFKDHVEKVVLVDEDATVLTYTPKALF